MLIGTTYSHRHASYLHLEPLKSFETLLDFGFETIRLACYWEEIEGRQGTYDFTKIKRLLDLCEEKEQRVVLTIGMKAPRWPEFYFPKWLTDRSPEGAEEYVYPYIEKSVKTLKKYTCITHWQVENEPLDPSGPKNLPIPRSILEKEISLVRANDDRPILVNLWGNELKKRKLLPLAEDVADVVGLDLYYKVPVIGRFYSGPKESDEKLAEIIRVSDKPFWITELQAEPWERNMLVASSHTPSMNAELLKKNFIRACTLKPEAILLWGFEYWLWRKAKGDSSLWNAAKEIVQERVV